MKYLYVFEDSTLKQSDSPPTQDDLERIDNQSQKIEQLEDEIHCLRNLD